MEIDNAHSSIVMLGDDLVIGKFNVTNYSDLLGLLDPTRTVLMPIFANYAFQDSPFQVQIQPQKIQLDYRAPELFPQALLDVAKQVAEVFESDGIRAIGINLEVIVNADRVGESGVDFCLRHFLTDRDHWLQLLAPDQDFSNSGRVNYVKDDILYTIRFEPHFKTDKERLFLDFNAHQSIEPPVTPAQLLSKYDDVRSYIEGILDNLLVDNQ